MSLEREAAITWVSPLERNAYREYRDEDFLNAVGIGHAYPQLKAFWPTRGPVWDGLGVLQQVGNEPGVVLIEAKSHPPECVGSTCKAAGESRKRIDAALRAAKAWAGVPNSCCWLDHIYQYGNRIAYLYFLREAVGVRAWLVYVYFINDPHSPTTESVWNQANKSIKQRLGLSSSLPGLIEVLIPAPTAAKS